MTEDQIFNLYALLVPVVFIVALVVASKIYPLDTRQSFGDWGFDLFERTMFCLIFTMMWPVFLTGGAVAGVAWLFYNKQKNGVWPKLPKRVEEL